MIEKNQLIGDNDLDHYLEKYALAQSRQAESENSYGVGGLLINLKTKEIIHQMHNTVIASENKSENSRLKDPTAHGERQLVDWYFANKKDMDLPEPADILIITTLDPCLMCTGSILSAGFKVIVAALDDSAGINHDNSYTFCPLQGKELEKTKNSFIYPEVIGDSKRNGYGTVPTFKQKTFSQNNVDECLESFKNGAGKARNIITDVIELKDTLDIKNLDSTSPIILALKAAYPDALKYRAKNPQQPSEGLSSFLITAAKEDIKYGGDGDAVAFLDCFGNLLMCKGGRKSLSPIRSAYMETIRAYQKVRYDLSANGKDNLRYLCEPKYGTFIFVKGFDMGSQSFADMGAYGSTILGDLIHNNNLQYITPRIPQERLIAYIEGMPDRYKKILKPKRVENLKLVTLVEAALNYPFID